MFHYIIINNTDNALQYAKTVSRELYKISVPIKNKKDITEYLFRVIKHKDQDLYALEVDLEYDIEIHPTKDVSQLIEMLSDDISVDKLQAIADQLNGLETIKFKHIIPENYEVNSYDEMVSLGWFNNENI